MPSLWRVDYVGQPKNGNQEYLQRDEMRLLCAAAKLKEERFSTEMNSAVIPAGLTCD